jgi:hypothetical protein
MSANKMEARPAVPRQTCMRDWVNGDLTIRGGLWQVSGGCALEYIMSSVHFWSVTSEKAWSSHSASLSGRCESYLAKI